MPAGANSPNSESMLAAGKPSSSSVGAFGKASSRLGAPTASTRSLPDFTCCATAGPALVESTSNWPLSASVTCWPPPLYGMCVMSTFAPALSCSSITWPSEAGPEVAQRTLPGLALAMASSSFMSLACVALVASSSTGEYITLATGTMSRAGSNGDLPRWGLSATGLIAAKPKVWPSVDLATASTPMLPLAPALFSITTDWPSAAAMRSPSARATTSLTPPGG